jgi:hypothetical protein
MGLAQIWKVFKHHDWFIFVSLIERFPIFFDIYDLPTVYFNKLFRVYLREYFRDTFSFSLLFFALAIQVLLNLIVDQYFYHVEHLRWASLHQIRLYLLWHFGRGGVHVMEWGELRDQKFDKGMMLWITLYKLRGLKIILVVMRLIDLSFNIIFRTILGSGAWLFIIFEMDVLLILELGWIRGLQ